MDGQKKHTRQWPHNIATGDLIYAKADLYSGFYLAPADHGIPTCGAVQPHDFGTSVHIFNYPKQTEEIARTLVTRWNAHNDMLEALKRFAGATLTPDGHVIGLMREDFEAARAAIAKAQGSEEA